MITEDYVSFEIAKLLKEKGFPLPSNNFRDWVFCMYDENGDIQWGCYHPDYYCRVTLQMAMKWLREVHYIHIEALCPIVDVDTDVFGVKYNVVISNLKNNCLAFNTGIEDNEYDTYEQACEAAIKYCLVNLI